LAEAVENFKVMASKAVLPHELDGILPTGKILPFQSNIDGESGQITSNCVNNVYYTANQVKQINTLRHGINSMVAKAVNEGRIYATRVLDKSSGVYVESVQISS